MDLNNTFCSCHFPEGANMGVRGSRFRQEWVCELTGEERSSEGGEESAEKGGPGLDQAKRGGLGLE